MSGFSPALLNTFCELGLEGLQSATPYSVLKTQLDNKRYNCLEEYCKYTIEQIRNPVICEEGNGWV